MRIVLSGATARGVLVKPTPFDQHPCIVSIFRPVALSFRKNDIVGVQDHYLELLKTSGRDVNESILVITWWIGDGNRLKVEIMFNG